MMQIGVAVTGGHTARYDGINSTIAGGGTMVALAEKGRMLCSQNARPGHKLLVTKEAAQVATSILAMSFPETVRNIMAVSGGQEQLVTEKLNTAGIQVSCAGRFVPKEEGLNLLSEDGRAKLTHPGTDPYWNAFFEAYKQGLK